MKKLKVLLVIALLALFNNSNAQSIFQLIKSGNLQEVVSRLASNPNSRDSLDGRGNSLLGSAIWENQPEIANLLIEKGADVNAVNKFQITPLFSAIEKGHKELVEILVDHGANVNFKSDYFGYPIHRAVYMNHPDILKLLIENGARLEVKDPSGRTPLQEAGLMGRIEEAKFLVEKGAEINTIDKNGLTALHYSILYGTDREGINHSKDLAELLIGNGASCNTVSNSGETPIFSAAKQGCTGIIELITKHGGDIKSLSGQKSQSLLHIAAMKGYGDMVDFLLSKGLDKNLKDSLGKTPQDYALKYGNEKIAITLSGKNKIVKKSKTASKYLNGKSGKNIAYVWYMNCRGWSVKAGDHLFVFDNEENGRIPDQPSLSNGWISSGEICDQNIVALYSAYHLLTDTVEFIHAKEDSVKRIVYIHYKDDQWRGGKNSRFIAGREIQRFDDVEIIPYETHDAYGMGSLGYLIRTKDITFFYPNFFPEDFELFKKEIDFLAEKTQTCDFAIIEVTPEKENIYAAYIMEKLNPKMIIPYDRSGNVGLYKAFKTEIRKKYPNVQVQIVEYPGDRVDYMKK